MLLYVFKLNKKNCLGGQNEKKKNNSIFLQISSFQVEFLS